jgi:hypothetical protein
VANLVTLGFGGRSLDPGARYNLQLHASSLASQAHEYDALAPVFTRPEGSGGVSATLKLDPDNPNDTLVTFNEPVGVGNGSTAPLPCVVYYEADLDGNAQVTSPGEWNANGNAALKCVANDPHVGYLLRPDEPSFGGASSTSAITGFSSRWRITTRPYQSVCVGNYQCCVGGVPLHLQFTRNPDGNSVVRRVNGAPVGDLGQLAVPQFQCP